MLYALIDLAVAYGPELVGLFETAAECHSAALAHLAYTDGLGDPVCYKL